MNNTGPCQKSLNAVNIISLMTCLPSASYEERRLVLKVAKHKNMLCRLFKLIFSKRIIKLEIEPKIVERISNADARFVSFLKINEDFSDDRILFSEAYVKLTKLLSKLHAREAVFYKKLLAGDFFSLDLKTAEEFVCEDIVERKAVFCKAHRLEQGWKIEYPIAGQPVIEGAQIRFVVEGPKPEHVRIFTREQVEITGAFPKIAKGLAYYASKQKRKFFVDAIAAAPDFELINTNRLFYGEKYGEMILYLYDVVLLRKEEELFKRLKRLDAVGALFKKQKYKTFVMPTKMIADEKEAIAYGKRYSKAGAGSGKGIILKDLDSFYEYGRTESWVKVRDIFANECVVVRDVVLDATVTKVTSLIGETNNGKRITFFYRTSNPWILNRPNLIGSVVEIKWLEDGTPIFNRYVSLRGYIDI